jgi:hypothetical protein
MNQGVHIYLPELSKNQLIIKRFSDNKQTIVHLLVSIEIHKL